MRFLIDADLPRSLGPLISSYGQEAIDSRDVGLRSAKDPEIATYIRREGLCLLTGDWGFSDIRAYPPERYAGIVVLQLPRNANAGYVAHLVESLLQRDDLIPALKGKLAIVEAGRVRLRP